MVWHLVPLNSFRPTQLNNMGLPFPSIPKSCGVFLICDLIDDFREPQCVLSSDEIQGSFKFQIWQVALFFGRVLSHMQTNGQFDCHKEHRTASRTSGEDQHNSHSFPHQVLFLVSMEVKKVDHHKIAVVFLSGCPTHKRVGEHDLQSSHSPQ